MRHSGRGIAQGALIVSLVAMWNCGDGSRANVESSPRWRLEEAVRIGSVNDPDQSLTRVVGPVISGDGQVYVGQPMEGVIRVFDASGHALRVVGRKGNGPGEFGSRLMVLGLQADTLFAVDFAGTIHFFSLDGVPLNSAPFRASLNDGLPLPTIVTGILPDGSVVATRAMRVGDPLVSLHLERTGELVDTLFVGAPPSIPMREGGMLFSIEDPFPSQSLFAVDDRHGRTVVVDRRPAQAAENPTFRVTVRTIGGDTIYSRAFPYMRIPVTQEEADSAIARVARPLSHVEPNARKAEELVRRAVSIPKYHSPVARALFADDGTLWLQLGEQRGVDKRWRAYDESGKPIGTVTVPENADVRVIHMGAMWAIVTDALDVPYIVKYQIIKDSEA